MEWATAALSKRSLVIKDDYWASLGSADVPLEANVPVEVEALLQSPRYFEHNREQVLCWFTPREHVLQELSKIERRFCASTEQRCCIHVRQGDYLQQTGRLSTPGRGWMLPKEYYRRAMRNIPADVERIVVSDARESWIRQEYQELRPDHVICSAVPVVDMLLFTRSRWNVIANSTFSWWGAWMNSDSDKHVYYPRYFLGWNCGTWTPPGIQVHGWYDVECR
jgi:hypothetical protein